MLSGEERAVLAMVCNAPAWWRVLAEDTARLRQIEDREWLRGLNKARSRRGLAPLRDLPTFTPLQGVSGGCSSHSGTR